MNPAAHRSGLVLQQPPGGSPALPPAVFPVIAFQRRLDCFVCDGQLARVRLLRLGSQPMDELAIPSSRLSLLVNRSWNIALGNCDPTKNFVMRQRHGCTCVSSYSSAGGGRKRKVCESSCLSQPRRQAAQYPSTSSSATLRPRVARRRLWSVESCVSHGNTRSAALESQPALSP
jgi:hypothetical protein